MLDASDPRARAPKTPDAPAEASASPRAAPSRARRSTSCTPPRADLTRRRRASTAPPIDHLRARPVDHLLARPVDHLLARPSTTSTPAHPPSTDPRASCTHALSTPPGTGAPSTPPSLMQTAPASATEQKIGGKIPLPGVVPAVSPLMRRKSLPHFEKTAGSKKCTRTLPFVPRCGTYPSPDAATQTGPASEPVAQAPGEQPDRSLKTG
jgi:hypothetical protein